MLLGKECPERKSQPALPDLFPQLAHNSLSGALCPMPCREFAVFRGVKAVSRFTPGRVPNPAPLPSEGSLCWGSAQGTQDLYSSLCSSCDEGVWGSA